MRLLVLGGTDFVGRAFVDDALERGWHVTTLNRQTRAPELGVESLRGNRWESDGLAELKGGRWDIVVDTWSWAPVAVRDAAAQLADSVDRYVYVSSRSVYESPLPAGATESAPLVESSPDLTEAEYPQAKRGGEIAAMEHFGDRALLLRAGLILGPNENIGRLPWWLGRAARGGDILAPGPADLGIQYVDARDLAAFGLDAAAAGLGGPFDIVSPPTATTMSDLLGACLAATGSDARLHWVDPAVILDAGVEPWTQLPAWLPPGELHDTLHGSDPSKALAAGLRIRPLRETVDDTWSWLQSLGGDAPQREDRPRLGLDPEVEARVLADQGFADRVSDLQRNE
ncbi:reductase [Glaciihabitans arcticus]|uniref:Reductase n=1 Tax=Glaciihabitans arcticus TaxID=2668039 RepID=A0A4V2JEQ5_9MICO|nr:reductase [Glaciihabitans arcticus]TBN56519.1 reductase [Glaciihabitans arcticus]